MLYSAGVITFGIGDEYNLGSSVRSFYKFELWKTCGFVTRLFT